MKKIFTVILALGFTAMSMGIALCQEEETVAPPVQAAPVSQKAVILGAARDKLMNKPWTVYIIPSTGPARAVETDVFTFTELRVRSEGLIAQGFSDSNYSMNLEGDMPVWETMQKTKTGDIAFLRGELRGDVMSGGVTIQPAKGGDQTGYGFSTVMPQAAPAVVEAQAVGAAPAAAAASSTTTTTTKKITKTTVRR